LAAANLNDSTHMRDRGKRDQRVHHAKEFAQGVADFRATLQQSAGKEAAPTKPRSGIKAAVRKRPLFPSELVGTYDAKLGIDAKEFDAVSCTPTEIWAHNACMRADLKNMYIEHSAFEFDQCFDQDDTTADVYDRAVRPLVAKAVGESGNACIIMFGQTGSGKTYTMGGIFEAACEHIFSAGRDSPVGLSFVEIDGNEIKDLLSASGSHGTQVKVMEDEQGHTQLIGASVSLSASREDLLACIEKGSLVRASASTLANEQSSRSHAVVQLRLGPESVVTLVDLAGSEWAADRQEHDKERQAEGAKINASLMALKQCLRASREGSKAHIPYRNSKLTHVLRGALSEDCDSTLLIATVSPGSLSTEHSLSTLEHMNARSMLQEAASTGSTAAKFVSIGLEREANKVLSANAATSCPATWTPSDVTVWWERSAADAVRQANALRDAEDEGAALDVTLEVNEPVSGGLGFMFRKLPVDSNPVVQGVKEESEGMKAVVAAVAKGGKEGENAAAAAVIFHSGASTLVGINGESLVGLDRAGSLAKLKEASSKGEWPVTLRFEIDPAVVGPGAPAPPEFAPPLPKYFTGKSRMGTADGRYLCQAFTLGRFLKESTPEGSEGHKHVSGLMYASLLQAWQAAKEHEHPLSVWRGA